MDVRNRAEYERRISRRIGRILRGEVDDLVRLLGDTPSMTNIPAEHWHAYAVVFTDALKPMLQDIFTDQINAEMENLNVSIDWGLINRDAANWASRYTFDLVRGITDTSRDLLQNAISQYYESGDMTIGDLIERLTRDFGPVRAERIAVTEVTRASSAGEEALAAELETAGIHMNEVWNTNNDELVCDICGPLDQTVKGTAWSVPPPAHVNCRCWVGLEIANG